MALNFDHQRDRISSTSGVIKINIDGALVLPKGTTAERPTPESGQIRFNSENNVFEGYNGVGWNVVGGVRDVDGDTYVIAESASSDNDQLDFFTAAFHRMQIDSDGTLRFGDGLDKFTVDWSTGDMYLAGNFNHDGIIDGGTF
jgi:hypothetical protein